MPQTADQHRSSQTPRSAYAGLDFIKAAFCPLDFSAMRLAEHPQWHHLGKDEGLAPLEVSSTLQYPRQFAYTDPHGNRKSGTQIISALFGMAPADFDLFLGLFTYLKRLPSLPEDGRTHLTVDFIARQCRLPADGQASYLRLRSRIFRLSYAKYTNSAYWNPEAREYEIVNFGFFNIAGLSRMNESRRPIVLEWDRSLFAILKRTAFLSFDYDLYRSFSPALRRFYLIANRDGWNQRDSSVFLADDFAIHQIGYSEKPELQKLRTQKLRRLLAAAEERGLIRPFKEWGGYFQRLSRGPRAGQMALRWSRGPNLRAKEEMPGRIHTDRVENDALYAQVQELHDEDGKPVSPQTFRRLVSKFSRTMMQKHLTVILAQKEHHPGGFTKSELAAFINRMQHDHPEPDWYQDLKRTERLSAFGEIQPNQLSMDMYQTFFRE